MKKAGVEVKKEFIACWQFPSLKWGFILSSVLSFLSAVVMAWPDSMLFLWGAMPYEVKLLIPEEILQPLAVFVFAMSALNRILKQKAVTNEKRKLEDRSE